MLAIHWDDIVQKCTISTPTAAHRVVIVHDYVQGQCDGRPRSSHLMVFRADHKIQ